MRSSAYFGRTMQGRRLPAAGNRMLVGGANTGGRHPRQAADSWIAHSRAIELHIDREPLHGQANDRQGRIFWQRSAPTSSLPTSSTSPSRTGGPGCFETFAHRRKEGCSGLGEALRPTCRARPRGRFLELRMPSVPATGCLPMSPFFFSAGTACSSTAARTEVGARHARAFSAGFAVEDEGAWTTSSSTVIACRSSTAAPR